MQLYCALWSHMASYEFILLNINHMSTFEPTISHTNYWDQVSSWKNFWKFCNGSPCRNTSGLSPRINVAACWKSSSTEACAKKLSHLLANNIDNGKRRIGLIIYVGYCILCDINHMSTYVTILRIINSYVDTWNHIVQCKAYADLWNHIAQYKPYVNIWNNPAHYVFICRQMDLYYTIWAICSHGIILRNRSNMSTYKTSGHYTIHLIEFDFLKSTSCVM